MTDESVFSRVNRGLLSARTVLGNLIFLIALVLLFGLMIGSCQSIDVEGNPALVLRPTGLLVEQHSIGSPLEEFLSGAGQREEVLLGELIESIERATDDDRIQVLVLDLSELEGLGLVHAETLEKALQKFRDAEKEVIGWGTWMSQANYRLLSSADALYMHPMGSLLFEGFGSHSLYFKDLLEKLKVNIHVFRVGEFKSAIEPFTQNGMSEEAKTANRELIMGLWADYSAAVSRNRQLDDGDFESFVQEIDQKIEVAGGDLARAALEAGLVDELLSVDEFNARVVDKVGDDANGDFHGIAYGDYLLATGGMPTADPDANIALIRLSGAILDNPDGTRAITPDSAREQIRAAHQDERIRAVVVRIDSPGGSAFASELIRRELELVQLAKKPVVVSMGEVAASGGYWIAATADSVFAHAQTITGSIGVFSILPSVENALAEVGVQSDGVGTGPLSAALNPYGPLPETYARIAQASVQRTYTDFLNLVVRGRSLELAEVQKIAEGRVWIGSKAKALGLVNEIGDLDAAITHAAKLANLESPVVREFAPSVDFRDALLHELLAFAPAPANGAGARLLTHIEQQVAVLTPMARNPGAPWALCAVCTTLQ